MVTLDSLEGHVIGQYELRKLMGVGGMGAVYRGLQTGLQRDVAVKVLSGKLSNNDEYIERFKREAQISAKLEHPNIVPIYDYGAEGDIIYVVMRLLTGGSLDERFGYNTAHERPLPSLTELITVLQQLASGLDYAHGMGVVHRDIKASNVMFDSSGTAFVVDFGIAKLMGTTSNLTGTGMAIGTPSYMSPEQWRGEDPVPASDQYSLAVMAFALLTGQLPFVADNQPALLYKHLSEAVPSIYSIRPELGIHIDHVFQRAMHKQHTHRYPTVSAFVEALAESLPDANTMSRLHQHTGYFTTELPSHQNTQRTPVTGARPHVVIPPPDDTLSGRTQPASATGSGYPPRPPSGTYPARPPSSTFESPSGRPSATMPAAPASKRKLPRTAIIVAVVLLLGGVGLIAFSTLNDDTPPPTATAVSVIATEDDNTGITTNEVLITKAPTSAPTADTRSGTPMLNIVRDNVAVRDMPTTASGISSTLSAGETVLLSGISEDDQWYQVQTNSGSGWVRISSSIEAIGDLQAIPVVIAPTATPRPTSTTSPSATPRVVPTWTPLSAASNNSANNTYAPIVDCPNALSSRLSPGMTGYVLEDDPRDLNVRSGPSTTYRKVGALSVGTQFEVIDGPRCNEDMAWFQINSDSYDGWIAEAGEIYFTGPYDTTQPFSRSESDQRVVDAMNAIGTCRNVIVEEDFESAVNSTWYEVTDSSRYSIQIRDGGYQINMMSIIPLPEVDPISWGSLQNVYFGNARVDAVIRATQFDPTPFSRTGIWVRYQDAENFLAFMIASSGKYRIARFEDSYESIVDWTPTNAILQGDNAVNTLTLEIEDNAYNFYINNQLVDSVRDAKWNTGRLAFFGSTTDQPAIFSLEYVRICDD